MIRISGNDKIKGVATSVCGYLDVLVKPDAVEEFVKSACIRIVNHVDVEIKITGNQELISTKDGGFQVVSKLS